MSRRDPWDNPEAQRWLQRCNDELRPMIEKSAVTMTLAPDKPDAKVAVELGFAMWLDKPIIVLAPKGRYIPDNLRKVAHAIITGEPTDPAVQVKLQKAMKELGL